MKERFDEEKIEHSQSSMFISDHQLNDDPSGEQSIKEELILDKLIDMDIEKGIMKRNHLL